MRRLRLLCASALLVSSTGCGGDAVAPTHGRPNNMVFITLPPPQILQGEDVSPAIVVEVRDSAGNVVTGSSLNVTLSFDTNPGSATLHGAATVGTNRGQAMFTDVSVDQRGHGYRLKASAPTLPPIVSTAFDVIAPLPVTKLAAGSEHTCAITTDGAAYCWGLDGATEDTLDVANPIPTQVETAVRFDTLTAGYFTTCGVTAAGAAYCWGSNFSARLGDSTQTDRPTPVPIQGAHVWTGQISVGFFHSCGLERSGAAYCWGYGNVGQLGDSVVPPHVSLALVPVAGGYTFKVVHSVNFHTCGLTTTYRVYCWGSNNQGALGDSTLTEKYAPTPVYGGGTFLTIVAGFSHSCAIGVDSYTYCWGANTVGQLGDGTTTMRLMPTRVIAAPALVSLTAHGQFTCGLTALGATWCWGQSYGSSPKAIVQPEPFTAIAAGFGHICGVTLTHRAYCWGVNTNGQLGDGTKTSRSAPTLVVY